MNNFTCLNENCDGKIRKMRTITTDNKNITKFCTITNFQLPSAEEGEESENKCPICGETLKQIGSNDSNYFAKIRSMNLADKHNYFAKRSIKHSQTDQDIVHRTKSLHAKHRAVKII